MFIQICLILHMYIYIYIICNIYTHFSIQGGQMYAPLDMRITGLNLVFLGWESFAYLLMTIVYEYLR
jgi:hypothetical protein